MHDNDMVTNGSAGQTSDPLTVVNDPLTDGADTARRAQLDALAVQVRDAYAGKPTLTINLVASQISATVQDVEEVLDEYAVAQDGSLTLLGPGQGHGWVPPAEMSLADPEHIGYRWPDGSLREEPFDITNKEHRLEMGITTE